MSDELQDLKALADALEAQCRGLAHKTAKLRAERGVSGDLTDGTGYLNGELFKKFYEELEVVRRAIAYANRPA